MTGDWVPEGFEFRGEVRPSLDGEHVLNFDGTAGLWTGERSLSWNVILHKIEKPKTYRPFANAAEFKPHRDRWIRRITNGGAFKIHDYCNDGSENDRSEVTSWEEFFSFGYVFDDDGSPFGVEVTE